MTRSSRFDRRWLGFPALASLLLLHGCSRGPQAPADATPNGSAPAPPTTVAELPPAVKALPFDLRNVKTGAVIDLSRRPAAALFENRALVIDLLTWVERTQVARVVDELEVQALFSPDGAGARARLGKLLKADLLVLLRESDSAAEGAGKNVKHLEMVVSETERGLRLAARIVPAANDTDAQVKEMESVLHGALAKVSETITEICAVPPFINEDLTYEYDYLKGALARALEQHLLGRKGVLVVELAEARAIAKEALLSGGQAQLERRLPLYFLGAFRNEGKDGERRLNVTLKLQRGETTVGDRQKAGIAPSEAPKALAALADALAEKVLSAAGPGIIDSRAESKQLNRRALDLRQLGNWRESLDLLEASLLLRPGDAAVHRDAAHACFMLVGQMSQRVRKEPALVIPMLQLHRRGMEHTEIGCRPTAKLDRPQAPNHGPYAAPAPSKHLSFAHSDVMHLRTHDQLTEESVQVLLATVKDHRRVMLELCRQRARAGLGDEHRFLSSAADMMPVALKISTVRNLIQELKDLPHAHERTLFFLDIAEDPGAFRNALNNPPFDALLDELAVDPNPLLRDASLTVKKRRAEHRAALNKRAPKAEPAAPATLDHISFRPLPLTHGKFKSTGQPAPMRIKDCLMLDGNVDCLMTGNALFLVRQKDAAKLVWMTRELNVGPAHFCFDGRYVWFSVNRMFNTPQLWVLDPETEKVFEIGERHGLPVAAPDTVPDKNEMQEIAVAPLSPGRICAAGYFGKSWIGIVTFGPSQDPAVKVIHEARETPQAGAPQWQKTTISFRPLRMFVLDAPGAPGVSVPKRRVVIVRDGLHNTTDHTLASHPLVVDADAPSVEAMKEMLYDTSAANGHAGDGAFYFYDFRKKALVKLSYPGTERTVLMKDIPQGPLVVVGDDVHVVNQSHWWHASYKQGEIYGLCSLPPGDARRIRRSRHYGILLTLSLPGVRSPNTFEVMVKSPR